MATVVANSSAISSTTALRINAIAKPKPRKSWQRRKEARPAEILEAALEEFSQKGFAAAHMSEIARRVNITKGTIYLYYKDKEALFRTLVSEMFGKALNEAVSRAVSSEPTVKGKLRTCAHTASTFLKEPKRADLLRILLSECKAFPQLAAIFGTEVVDKITEPLSGIITAGRQRGELRNLPASRVAHFCLAQILFDVVWWPLFERLDEEAISSATAISMQTEILLHGCLQNQTEIRDPEQSTGAMVNDRC